MPGIFIEDIDEVISTGTVAGGFYENQGALNRWKLRQYPIGTGNHADRFAAYFAAARQLVDIGLFNGRNVVTFRTLGLV